MPHLLLGKVFTAPLPLEKKKVLLFKCERGSCRQTGIPGCSPQTPSVAAVMFWAATLVKDQKKKLPQASLCTHSNLNLKFQSVYARNQQNETPKLSHNWNLSSHTHTHTHTHATPPSPPSLYPHPSSSSSSPSQASLLALVKTKRTGAQGLLIFISLPGWRQPTPPCAPSQAPSARARSLSRRHIHLPSPALSHTINSHAHQLAEKSPGTNIFILIQLRPKRSHRIFFHSLKTKSKTQIWLHCFISKRPMVCLSFTFYQYPL